MNKHIFVGFLLSFGLLFAWILYFLLYDVSPESLLPAADSSADSKFLLSSR